MLDRLRARLAELEQAEQQMVARWQEAQANVNHIRGRIAEVRTIIAESETPNADVIKPSRRRRALGTDNAAAPPVAPGAAEQTPS